jgi:organic radical activating enzyme
MTNNEFIHNIYAEIIDTKETPEHVSAAIGIILQELKDQKVIIYPAGAVGKLLAKTLSYYNISPEFFIDRQATDIKSVDGVEVRDPSVLAKIDDGYTILVAANRRTLFDTLNTAVMAQNPSIPVMDGFIINRILRYPLCQKQLDSRISFDITQCENCGYEGKGCRFCLAYLKRVAPGERSEDTWRSRSFDWFGYIVGQRCTMKCRHCCESIPYLKNPGFVPCEMIISDITKVAQSSHFLKFVEFIGGEPFLHPEFEKLLKESLRIENIGYIKSFTNGTVVPKDSLCEILKNPRIMIQLSNYEKTLTGALRENFLKTKKKFDDWGIHYVYAPNTEWRDFSSFDLHHDPVHSLETIFKECPLAGCHRLYKGKLYRCPHQYAGVEQGKLKKLPVECIEIHQFSQEDLGKAIESFEQVSYIDACRYCTMPFDAVAVPAGEQINDKHSE